MSKPPRKFRRKPDERPDQILDAALNVFADKGFRAATMDDVAAAAGITKGTIYLYFNSKEGLFISAVRRPLRKALDILPRISYRLGDSPESFIKELGRQFLDVLMQPDVTKVIPLIVGELNHLPALKQVYKAEVLPNANIHVAGLMESAMAAGLVRRLDPVIAARCLMGMFAIFVITQELFEAKEVTPMEIDDIAETAASIFWRGVANRGSES